MCTFHATSTPNTHQASSSLPPCLSRRPFVEPTISPSASNCATQQETHSPHTARLVAPIDVFALSSHPFAVLQHRALPPLLRPHRPHRNIRPRVLRTGSDQLTRPAIYVLCHLLFNHASPSLRHDTIPPFPAAPEQTHSLPYGDLQLTAC